MGDEEFGILLIGGFIGEGTGHAVVVEAAEENVLGMTADVHSAISEMKLRVLIAQEEVRFNEERLVGRGGDIWIAVNRRDAAVDVATGADIAEEVCVEEEAHPSVTAFRE